MSSPQTDAQPVTAEAGARRRAGWDPPNPPELAAKPGGDAGQRRSAVICRSRAVEDAGTVDEGTRMTVMVSDIVR